MAADLEPLMAEWLGAEKTEETRGQTTSLSKTEDLLEMVKKLQKEGSLEPQIEALIHRINELQQGKFGNLDRPVGTSRKEPGLLNAKEQLEEQLEDLTSQRKDLWEFRVLQQRLTQEISTMERSKDQLLMESEAGQ
ncbi:synaptonemal complex central element protein 1 like [Cricetulus griseus]